VSQSPPVAVLGAGIAGLVAARQLARHGVPVIVYEGGPVIAGMARTVTDADGFSYDVGAHFITNRLAAALGIAGRCRTVHHYGEVVRVDGRDRAYPMGLLTVPRYVGSAMRDRVRRHNGPPASVAERFRREYGTAMAEEIAIPLVEAWSGVPADELAPSVADKIPQSIPETLRLRFAARRLNRAVAIGYCGSKPQSASVYHVYPQKGVSTLCEAIADELGDVVQLSTPVEKIYVEDGVAVGVRAAGFDQATSAVISTAPISVLPKLVEGTDALEPYRAFRFRGLVLVNLKLRGRGLLPDTMMWFPQGGYPFFRLCEAPLSMPWLAPDGATMITADIGAAIGDEHWTMSDDDLIALTVDHFSRVCPDAHTRCIGGTVLRQPLGYPVFHTSYEADRQRLEGGTGVEGLLSIGRNGEFDHILMEDIYWRTLAKVEAWLAAPTMGRWPTPTPMDPAVPTPA
jgi:protoporphyrinogen/coproporphyrinogen III oxidase